MEYRFKEDWFERDAKGAFERNLLKHPFPIKSYLEVGVCEGRSMLWMLDNLPIERAVGVDWWRSPRGRKNQHVFDGYKKNAMHNLKPEMESGRLKIVEQSSKVALANMTEKFDLIYCDGDHSGQGAMRDWLLAFDLLTPATNQRKMRIDMIRPTGGIMIIDDLQRAWNRHAEVRVAFCQFKLLMHGRAQLLWEDKRQAAFIRVQ